MAEIAKHLVLDYHDYRKVWFIYFIYYARRQHSAIQHTIKSTMIREKTEIKTHKMEIKVQAHNELIGNTAFGR